MKKVAIVVTTHADKENLSDDDRVSLYRMLDLFRGVFDTFVVSPVGMNVSEYLNAGIDHVVELEGSNFGSIERYNRMMLKPSFYEKFSDYEYILIHHLDAYIFGGDLESWCDAGYDYIGAPWRKPSIGRFWLRYLFANCRFRVCLLYTSPSPRDA